MFEEDEHNP